MSLLALSGLVKRFGGLIATDNVDLDVKAGEVHAVIGPNGAGKTTLINQIVGEIAPDAGRITFNGTEITPLPTHQRALAGLSRSYQITSVFPEFSALENVLLAAQAHAGSSFNAWRPVASEAALVAPARETLGQVGLGAKADVPTAALAHGERRQLELAMALVTRPKLLVLDEPMAGMGQQESESMVRLLAGLKGRYTMLLVEHDMNAVFALADRITVLVYGRVIACDAPTAIRTNLEVRRAYLGEKDNSSSGSPS